MSEPKIYYCLKYKVLETLALSFVYWKGSTSQHSKKRTDDGQAFLFQQYSIVHYTELFLHVWVWFVIVFISEWIMKIPVECRGWSPLVLKRFVLVQWRETRGERPVSLTQSRSDGRLRSSSESREHKTMYVFLKGSDFIDFRRKLTM